MAIDPVKYWQFKAETKRHIAELRKKLHDVSINGGGGSGGGGGTDIDLSDYATMRWVESQGYVKSADLSGYALASQIPTKVSQLTNDANYLKSSSTPLAFSVYALNVRSSLSLRAYSSSAPDDAPDIGFFSYSNEEIGRIYKPAGIERFYVRFGANKPSYSLAFTSDLEPLTTTVSNLEAKLDRMFEIDGNGYIKAKMSLYSEGSISAKGIGSGSSGGGSGTSYSRLDSWTDYNADKATYVLSALLGNDLNTRLTNLETAGYITAEALLPYAKTSDLSEYAKRTEIPSLNGYATQDWVNDTLNDYALASDIPSLTGYATEVWVNNQLANKIPTNNNQLTNGEGYIKGIDSAMVVGALNYTPFNAANFTKANIKNTLGIADWALAATKPSYAWSEITSRPTALSQFADDVVAGNYLPIGGTAVRANTISLNSISANTTYGEYAGIIQSHTGGAEEGAWHNSLRILHNNSSGYYTEICQNFTGTDALYYRRMENGSLSAWHRVLDERGGYINENAYLKFTSTDGQGGKFGYYKMDNPTLGNYVEFFNDSSKVGIHLHDNGEIYTYRGSRYTNVDSGNIINYTAGAALSLAHSHTLWGRPFDGTSDVSGSLSGVVNITASGNITADSITIGGITLSVVNGALKIAGSMYATGAITAKKVG